jgi:hypothetical protein
VKTILSSWRDRYLTKFTIFLVMVALIAGMVGCSGHISEDLEIYDWYGLDKVRYNLNGHHTLMNDLDFTTEGYAAVHSGKGWQPIGISKRDQFTGSFDGQGNNISDLYINRPNDDNVGLFGYVDKGGVIKNVRVVDVAVTGDCNVGGLVGNNGGTVEYSYSTGNVTSKYGSSIGGLVGINDGGTVSSSNFTGSVDGDDGVGGLVGDNTGNVSNSYSIGSSVIGYYGVGGLVGYNKGGSVSSSNSTGSVDGFDGVGGLVGDNTGTVSNSYSTGSSVDGCYGVGGLVGYNNGGSMSICNFTGSVSGRSQVGGVAGNNSGTVENSHSNGNVTGSNDYVGGLVGNNIGTVSNSYSTGSVTGNDEVGGLVGNNEKGTVSSSYSTGSVTGNDEVGGLVGNNTGTVSSSNSTGSVTGENGVGVGGLVGNNEKGTVSNSYSTGSVTGDENVGGLVGSNIDRGTVSNSCSTGSVNGTDGVGGLVGRNYKGFVSNSHYNYDEVLINSKEIITIGALFGEDFEEWLANDKFLDINDRLSQESGYYVVNNVTDFKELLAFGQDSSLKFRLNTDLDLATEPDFYIPYLAGKFYGNSHTISNLSLNLDFVYNVGLFGYLARGGKVTQVGVENVDITGASSVGGLVGYNWEGTVRASNSTGSVTGNDDVGGLVGSNDAGTVGNKYASIVEENCNSTCSVTGKNEHVGGLVGYNYKEGEVYNSYSTGSVTGNEDVGGLVGQNEGKVEDSYSTGSVNKGLSQYGDVVGGLVGLNEGIVGESYSTGSVSGDYRVGGLVGVNYDEVSNCYSTGSVSGDSYVGGLVGYTGNDYEDKVNRTYSSGSVSGDSYVGGLVGFWKMGDVSNSFWDKDTSHMDESDGGIGLNTEDMMDIDTFEWDICEVAPGETDRGCTWNIVDIESYPNDATYPFLSWQP